ncbi:hypothetical protein VNI00_017281 [Paramarasmius palmivorus]|uniref:Uncharacterized protein n=1 Tax=Paramarasmius palmivorus TaxID=297713 RepID=A0AAW0B7K3_9AGAR
MDHRHDYRYWVYPRGPPSISQPFPSLLQITLRAASEDLKTVAQGVGKTRRSSDVAYEGWREKWLEVFHNNEQLCDQIISWLAVATHCQEHELSEDVQLKDMIDLVISVSLLTEHGLEEDALEDLALWQNHIVTRTPFKQRSALWEVAGNIHMYDSQALVEAGGYEHGTTGEEPIGGMLDTSSHTDARSVPAGATSVDEEVEPWDLDLDTEDIDYQKLLRQCQRWKESLRDSLYRRRESSLGHANDDFLSLSFQEAQSKLVSVIREMRNVEPKRYRTAQFSWAMQGSGLNKLVSQVSSPSFPFDEGSPHIPTFTRLHAFGETLGGIIDEWTPIQWRDHAWKVLGDRCFLRVPLGGAKKLTKPPALLEAFCQNPSIIPCASNPAYVYFLLSEDNFKKDWFRWLAWGLRSMNYIVTDIEPKSLFRMFWQNIWNLRQTLDPETGEDKYSSLSIPVTLRAIIDRSLDYREKRGSFRKRIHDQCQKVRWNKPVFCEKCAKVGEADKCRRVVIYPWKDDPKLRSQYLFTGVSNAPLQDRMKPRQGNGRTNPSTIHTTDELGLTCIEASATALKECQQQVVYVCEREGGPVVDFIAYDIFPPDVLQELEEAVDQETGVKPVRRGSNKDRWNSGSMRCFGARVASGGRPADEYVFYAGIEAESLEGIEVLFKQALSAMYTQEVTKLLHPDMLDELKRKGEPCERVGEYGINLFTCEGYTAPLHDDDDVCRSICSQIRWDAKPEYSEFSFCQLEYGYYIRTRANMLW